MSKERISLDLPDLSEFKPRPRQTVGEKKEIEKVAKLAGFKTRHSDAAQKEEPRIDGRTLRRKNKSAQLNIAVSDATRNRFWILAQDHELTSGEDLLLQLMDVFETSVR